MWWQMNARSSASASILWNALDYLKWNNSYNSADLWVLYGKKFHTCYMNSVELVSMECMIIKTETGLEDWEAKH